MSGYVRLLFFFCAFVALSLLGWPNNQDTQDGAPYIQKCIFNVLLQASKPSTIPSCIPLIMAPSNQRAWPQIQDHIISKFRYTIHHLTPSLPSKKDLAAIVSGCVPWFWQSTEFRSTLLGATFHESCELSLMKMQQNGGSGKRKLLSRMSVQPPNTQGPFSLPQLPSPQIAC